MQDPYPRKLYLSKKAVMGLLDMDRSTFDRWRKQQPSFPLPIPDEMTGKRLRWSKEDVYEWLVIHWKTPRPAT